MNSQNERVPRELTGFRKVGYASGAMAQMGGFGLYNAFTFQYYVYTIRLDPLITSIGLFIGLFVYAITAPVMGVVADNRVPDKYGKRKKFLLIGAPLQMILLFLLWTPPVPSTIWTAIYMWSVSGLLNFTQATIVSAYLSMLTDQCQTEKNRVETASLQGLFSIIGTFVSVLLPIIIQSLLQDPQNPAWDTPSGELLMKAMPIIGGLYGIITLVIFFIVYKVTDESFYEKDLRAKKKQFLIPLEISLSRCKTRDTDFGFIIRSYSIWRCDF
jgi:Na+/melibiose symporter-like transporter